MAFVLLLLFISVPIVEIALLIQVGGWLGLWPTVGLVVLTAVVGTALLRQQGFAILRRARDSLSRDEMPMAEVFDGICLVFAGALLLTPGFVTDTIGFLLLTPPVRLVLRAWLAKGLAEGKVHVFQAGPGMGPGPGRGPGRGPAGGPVIDGEFQEVPEAPDPDAARLPPDGRA